MKTLLALGVLAVFLSCTVIAQDHQVTQQVLPGPPPTPYHEEEGELYNWQIMAIVLPCLFIGLGLIFCIICCCFKCACAVCETVCDDCCGPSCGSMCGPQHCCGQCCGPRSCCGPMCDPKYCCDPKACCGPMCDPQQCCGPACCGSCCGPCCYQQTEVPAPVIKSAPYATRSPLWPQQQGFNCPSTGVPMGHVSGGGGMSSGGLAYGKSMDGNYSNGKLMFGGSGGHCAPCGPPHQASAPPAAQCGPCGGGGARF